MSPPAAGPMERAMLMPSEFNATALFRSLRGTSSGTIDCQVGPMSAAPMPPTKVSAIRYSTVSAPVWESTSRVPLTAASTSCTKIRKRRRSRMSESTPAGIASRKIGSVAAVWISATAVGLAERSVTSHELATSRMKLPMLPSTVAAHSAREHRLAQGSESAGRRSASALGGISHGCAPSGRAMPRAQSRRPGPGVRRMNWRP